jgi:hypothetical protein
MSNFYNQASWVLVPDGIEEDIVFAQKPTSGLGDLTFTRASDATYTDSTGVVRRSPYNLVQFSEEFDNAYWTKVKGGVALIPVVTANVEVAPNGTMTADRIVFNLNGGTTGSDFSQLRSGSFIYSSDTRTQSIYLRTTDNTNKVFTYVSPTGSQTSITVTPTYQRFTFTSTGVGSDTIRLRLLGAGEGTATSATVAAWGAQFVEGTSALDYFPTTNRQDVPRIDFRNADGTLSSCGRLLLEPQRTNSIRNSTMVGAVAGSPGTLPNNWLVTNAGLTQTVVGTGTENGLPYIDLRFNGTASAAEVLVASELGSAIAATSGQTWSSAVYARTIAAPAAPNTRNLRIAEISAIGTIVVRQLFPVTLTSTLQRFAGTRTLNGGATVAFVNSGLLFELTIGNTYDFTIRIAAPQMELGAYATTFIPTTTAAVTRLRDEAQKTGVSSIIGQSAGTIFWDITDLTGTVTGTGNPDFGIRNTAFTNWIGITTDTFATPFRVVVRATSGVLISYIANITRVKAAVAWSSAGAVLYVNGVQVGTSAVNPNFSFDRIDMLGGIISYKTNQAALFPTRITNEQLQSLTTL